MRSMPANQRLRIRILQIGAVLVAALMLVVRPAVNPDLHESR